tara:strand:+ start:4562 stop:5242 length:681 start_codon:yes stop_codon:yes gene_type:complete
MDVPNIQNINDNFDKKIENDHDNAHDRTVNELSKYYYEYLKNNTNIDYDIDNMLTHINNDNINDLDKNLILNYLNQLLLNNDNITNFECNEFDFLILCWNRSLMEINKENTKYIQASILNNIVDFYSTDYDLFNNLIIKKLCCPSGRIMKLLSSFCYLDNNKTLGGFLSTDMLRKEFLNKASIKYINNISYNDYYNILNNIILEYNKIYHEQLKKFRDTLIESLVF